MELSTAPPEISGVCMISGLWGVGKTTLAMTCENPELVTIFDFDQKSMARAKSLGMEYHSPAEVGLDDPLEYNLDKIVTWFRKAINELEPQNKTTLIIDNGSPVEKAFTELVKKNPDHYGVRASNVQSGRFGGANPGVGVLWNSLVNFLQKTGYERIFIVMHMSQVWTNAGPVPNRYKVKGNKTLSQLSNLSLVLMQSSIPTDAPDAIVLKEALGIIKYDDGAFDIARALPPRIPDCTWSTISKYLAAGKKSKFNPSEIPTAFEMSCYGQFMTPEQVAYIKAVADNPNFSVTEEEIDKETTTSDTCPICHASTPSGSDKGHAPWCKVKDGKRYDSRK